MDQLFRGYGYTPHFVEGSDPAKMHQLMAGAVDTCMEEIRSIQTQARTQGVKERPRWPMIILRSPKGWTCPKEIDGKRTEDYWRSHQVPMGEMHEKPGHVKILEKWMKSYKPEELFDKTGRLKPELADLPPKGERRMSDNPHANGGLLLKDLRLPDFRDYAVKVTTPGAISAESTRLMGKFLRDTMKLNMESRNFRLFSPDENNSNRWQDVMEVTNRAWMADRYPYDDHLAPDGRVMEMLSEHQCQGWLEGYLLSGRHGFFSCYEAFIHIIDSMFNQHAKWLKVCHDIPWRRPIASLNYLLSSHVWRQDHNGFSHQDPGFIDHVVNKKVGGRARLSAAGCEYAAVGHRSLSAEPQLCERHRRGQAARSAMVDDGPGDQTLHGGHRNLGMGQQRQGGRSRCRSWPVAGTCLRWRLWPPWICFVSISRR